MLTDGELRYFGIPDPNRALDACFNNICLRNDIHDAWNKGKIALRPVSISSIHTQVKVIFYWQSKQHNFEDSIELVELPQSSRDLRCVDSTKIACADMDGDMVQVKSRDIFTLTTTNPQTHPMPSPGLLEMRLYLNRAVAMSGAADVYVDENAYDHSTGDRSDDEDRYGDRNTLFLIGTYLLMRALRL